MFPLALFFFLYIRGLNLKELGECILQCSWHFSTPSEFDARLCNRQKELLQ